MWIIIVVKERNAKKKKHMVADLAEGIKMTMVKIYFKKTKEHKWREVHTGGLYAEGSV